MEMLKGVSSVLLAIGGVNWGLISLANFDLVQALFGGETRYKPSAMSKAIYGLVGISALSLLTCALMAEDEGKFDL